MDKFQAFGKNIRYVCRKNESPFASVVVYSADFALSSASFTPFAARTQQFVKEQLGQADDKVNIVFSIWLLKNARRDTG